ncbi:MAG: FAD-dependent oxidoreductase [Deltaproteobacteria bacterium]
MTQPDLTCSSPPYWRVAVIGSGPAGFYAVGELLKQQEMPVKVDLFDRLPTPYGLVRGGVAPDHQKIKAVCKIFDRIAGQEHFRYFGNVEFGRDLNRSEMLDHYDAVLYTVGSRSDRKLGIPGEDLEGSHSATEFVGWYNAHPDYRDKRFNLDSGQAVIIGMGNVAIDVARILSHRHEELAQTDISDEALSALASSRVKDIWIIGRRGPVQAAFTPVEARELMHLPETEVVLEADALDLDPASQRFLQEEAGKDTRKNIDLLEEMLETPPREKKKRLHILFLASPVEIVGEQGKVSSIKLRRNQLVEKPDGSIRAEGTDRMLELKTGLVFRSVGYRGEPLPGVPFDEISGTIPNEQGQILEEESPCPREYTAGWIKRGPSGVVGTNKPDAIESVKKMLSALDSSGKKPLETEQVPDIGQLLRKREVDFVSFQDWKLLEEYETKAGEAEGRPRKKVGTVKEMMEVVRSLREG